MGRGGAGRIRKSVHDPMKRTAKAGRPDWERYGVMVQAPQGENARATQRVPDFGHADAIAHGSPFMQISVPPIQRTRSDARSSSSKVEALVAERSTRATSRIKRSSEATRNRPRTP